MKSPAVIVVGEVCSLSASFDWFSGLPLQGVNILVTRPKERAGTLTEKLQALGANVTAYPCIETEEMYPNPRAVAALQELSNYQWLVLTSAAGVDSLFHLLDQLNGDARMLAPVKIAVIGAGTAQELEKHGVRADFVPEIYDAAHLAKGLVAVISQGERALILRAEAGTQELTFGLDAAAIPYLDIPVYRTYYRSGNREEAAELLRCGNMDYVTFTSASTVMGFVKSLPGIDFSGVKGVCIGVSTEKEAVKHGIRTFTAKNATIEELVQAILDDYATATADGLE